MGLFFQIMVHVRRCLVDVFTGVSCMGRHVGPSVLGQSARRRLRLLCWRPCLCGSGRLLALGLRGDLFSPFPAEGLELLFGRVHGGGSGSVVRIRLDGVGCTGRVPAADRSEVGTGDGDGYVESCRLYAKLRALAAQLQTGEHGLWIFTSARKDRRARPKGAAGWRAPQASMT